MPFTPTDISGCKLWLKADAGAYKDAGTTLAANTETIQQWNDQSGQGNNAGQSTSANRPTYTTGVINGLPVLRFDASNDRMTGSGPTFSQPGTLFIVARAFNVAMAIFTGATSGSDSFLLDSSGGSGHFYSYAGTLLDSTIDAATNQNKEWCLIFNGASSKIRHKGVEVASGNAGANGIAGYTLGDYAGGGRLLSGDIAEIILYNSVLSATDIQSVEDYLARRYALYKVSHTNNYAWPGAIQPNAGYPGAIQPQPASGTVFNQTLSVSVSTSISLLRQVGKTLSDSVSSASQMIRQQGKTLSANASNTPTITKQTTRSLSVDESSSSTLGKQISKTLVDSISSSSTITRQAAKGINLSASSTSNIDTQVGHSLTVNADHTTALTKQVGKPLSVLESQSSSLTRQVAKTLSLSVSVNNVLVATKVFLQSLNVNVSSTSQMVRQVGKTLSLGVVVVTSVVKLISHALSLTASGLVSLTKQVGKPLAFIVQAQPTQTQVKARSQNLSVDVASSSTLTKLVSKSFSVTCSVSTFLFKQTAKTLSVGVSSVKSLFKGIGKLLGLSTASTSTLNTQVTSGDVTPGTLSAVRHIITVDLSITPATGAFPPFRQDFYRTDYSSGSPVSTLIHSGPELTFIDTQLQPNTLYGYQVRVFDNTGASNSSNFVQVTTLPITTKEKITWSGSTAIRVNWEGKTTIKIIWD